jgi:hypothetical protein
MNVCRNAEKKVRNCVQGDNLLACKWRHVHDVYKLSKGHNDKMADASVIKGAHEEIELSVMFCSKY